MNGYLLDSTVLIDLQRGFSPVAAWLRNTVVHDIPIYLSPVTVAEHMSGIRTSERAATLDDLRAYPILPIDLDVAYTAGVYRYDQARAGLAVSTPDALQVAVAKQHGLVVATSNPDHYQGVRTLDPRNAQET